VACIKLLLEHLEPLAEDEAQAAHADPAGSEASLSPPAWPGQQTGTPLPGTGTPLSCRAGTQHAPQHWPQIQEMPVRGRGLEQVFSLFSCNLIT